MRQHYKIEKQLNRQAESALDLVLGVAIGLGLAILIVAWWSA